MRTTLRLLVLVAALGTPAFIGAQVSPRTTPTASAVRDTVVEIRLRDGSIFYGRIEEETADRVVIVTMAGARVELIRAQIESLRVTAGRSANGTFWTEDPNHTRLFFSSTARPLGKGEGYISSFMLFFPFVAYGVTERFTLAGGTPILPGAIGKLFYLAPKYTLVQKPKSSFAAGALGFVSTGQIDEGSVGIVYGVGTWGSREAAITAGAGWGYSAGNSGSGLSNDPIFVVGGEKRVSRRVKLITENWFFVGSGASGALVSGGLRFIGDRLAADLAIGGFSTGGNGACCMPIVNFVYNFGNRKR